jgi:hypothetical protein
LPGSSTNARGETMSCRGRFFVPTDGCGELLGEAWKMGGVKVTHEAYLNPVSTQQVVAFVAESDPAAHKFVAHRATIQACRQRNGHDCWVRGLALTEKLEAQPF